MSPLAARPFASGTYLLSTSLGDSLSAYPSPGASPAHSPTPASAAASTSPQLHSHLVRQSTYPRGLPASLGLPSFAGASYRILSLDLLVLPPGSAADAKKGMRCEQNTLMTLTRRTLFQQTTITYNTHAHIDTHTGVREASLCCDVFP